jgi:N-acetylmuramoyl-L-alanine amidase
MVACGSMADPTPEPTIHAWPLPYAARLEARELAGIDLVVMHCTELPDLTSAREYGERIHYPTGTGDSGHFYVDRDGAIHCFVEPVRIAHHTRGFNPRSIGIELVNRGRWPDWLDSRRQQMEEPYPGAQIQALVALLRHLGAALPSLQFIAGHEDLDTTRVAASDDPAVEVYRKRDPGPLFPWDEVLAAVALQRFLP